jgi:hypothetical protein
MDDYMLLIEGICIVCGKVWWGWELESGYVNGEFICDDCILKESD